MYVQLFVLLLIFTTLLIWMFKSRSIRGLHETGVSMIMGACARVYAHERCSCIVLGSPTELLYMCASARMPFTGVAAGFLIDQSENADSHNHMCGYGIHTPVCAFVCKHA